MAHKHSIYDTDTHFSIDPATRAITNLSTTKTKLVQYDHNSERFTFEMPRFVDGHDMSLCDKIEVHFINISSNKNQQNADVYLCDDVQVSPDDENVVIFSWLISQNATQYAGTLNFLIRFVCLTGATVDYVWSTCVFSSLTISDGMNNSDIVVEEYSDVLEAWRMDLDKRVIQSVEQTVKSEENGGTNVWAMRFGDGSTSMLEVKNGERGASAKWYTVDGNSPSVQLGNEGFDVGDMCIGVGGPVLGNVYRYENGAWSDALFNLIGPQGEKGEKGENGGYYDGIYLKQTRITNLPVEIGNVNFVDGMVPDFEDTWAMDKRARLVKGCALSLKAGDKIGLSDYTDKRFYVGCLDTPYAVKGWLTEDFVVPKDGNYSVLIAYQTDTVLSSAYELGKFLFVEISKSDVIDIRYCPNTNFSPNDFVNGDAQFWNGANPNKWGKYRVMCTLETIYKYPQDVYIRAAEGFRFAVGYYNDGVFNNVDNGWYTELTIPAQQEFRIMIARATDNASEIADVAEFVSKITILTSALKEISDASTNREDAPPEVKVQKIKSINHRGYNTVAPENTLAAFKLSKKNGFDFVECDLRWTSDGVPVLLHDPSINRTARNADGSGLAATVNISDITYEQALSYDFGIWKGSEYAGTKIPTFTEFIKLCRNLGLHPYIELETLPTTAQAQSLIDIVKDCGLIDGVTWISYNASFLKQILSVYKRARVGLLCWDPITDSLYGYLESLKTAKNEVFLDIRYDLLTDECIERIKPSGIGLEVWTPETAELILSLNPYVSGVTTDVLIAEKVLYDANIE